MKVLVCGGRRYADHPFVFTILDRVHAKRTITLIIEGGASGADRFAREWAIARGVRYQTFDANWRRYGMRAGPVRNHKMLREGRPDFVVAFAGGSGTSHMVRISKEAGLPVLETWRFTRPTARPATPENRSLPSRCRPPSARRETASCHW